MRAMSCFVGCNTSAGQIGLSRDIRPGGAAFVPRASRTPLPLREGSPRRRSRFSVSSSWHPERLATLYVVACSSRSAEAPACRSHEDRPRMTESTSAVWMGGWQSACRLRGLASRVTAPRSGFFSGSPDKRVALGITDVTSLGGSKMLPRRGRVFLSACWQGGPLARWIRTTRWGGG